MTFGLESVFYFNLFIGLIQLMMSVFLFIRRSNTAGNRLLAILMLLPVFTILSNTFLFILKWHNFIFLNSINSALMITFGPVFISYLRILQGRKINVDARFLLHFIPALLILLSAFQYFVMTEPQRIHALSRIIAGEDLYSNVINLLLLCHVMVYLIMAYREVRSYASHVLNFYSTIELVQLQWMRSIVSFIIILNSSTLFLFLFPIVVTGRGNIYVDLVAIPGIVCLLYGFMVYKGFSYNAIYDQASYKELLTHTGRLNSFIDSQLKPDERIPAQENSKEPGTSHKQSDVKVSDKPELANRIQQLLDQEKIYTNPDLNLQKLSDELNAPAYLVSKIITSELGETFYDLINKRRIRKAQELLSADHNFSIEGIAYEVGFNSRSTFYRAFKKYIGQHPKEFWDKKKPER